MALGDKVKDELLPAGRSPWKINQAEQRRLDTRLEEHEAVSTATA